MNGTISIIKNIIEVIARIARRAVDKTDCGYTGLQEKGEKQDLLRQLGQVFAGICDLSRPPRRGIYKENYN
ncbi:hypothetical protein [Methanocella arvoryzae]|uniref:Uncharacterized protein n=1 Tax=Methanocella arvoryzae (strain DSM 22066 / NBRC 105507 / MRE50) TaxID=351160 RepID=Q0W7R3_METAR|nr:hypothetical protein [Methanocella arvoryzae]CAJ35580.1 hypothetical protein RCIX73 [Methanocella arvoryzae MRE50]